MTTDVDPDMLAGDIVLAEQYVRDHGVQARYVPAWKQWLFWDTQRWKRDATGEDLRRAQLTVRGLYTAAALAETAAERAQRVKHAQRADQRRRMEAMLALAAVNRAVVVTPEQLDADPWLFNTEHGTVDLRTGICRPAQMADLVTKLAPVTYDPEATCPTFERFLARILGDDAAMLGFLQRAIGYALTGSTREQCFFVLHGNGANGKSTLLSAIHGMLGDYALGADIETLLAANRPGHGANPDLMRLRGARFVTATEATAERRLAEGLLKRLTGGDPIVGRDLYQPGGEEFIATLKLFLAVNHLPVIRDATHAMWRRVHRLPFTVSIAEADQDPALLDKLHAERPGILRWAVEGCLAWQRHGLGAPARVRQATAEYRADQDPLGAFLLARCRLEAAASVGAEPLYAAYTAWCRQGIDGEPIEPITLTAFGRELGHRGFTGHRTTHGRYRLGLRLLDPGEADDGFAPMTGCDGLYGKSSYARAGGEFIEKPDTNPSPPPNPSPLADETSDMFDPPERA